MKTSRVTRVLGLTLCLIWSCGASDDGRGDASAGSAGAAAIAGAITHAGEASGGNGTSGGPTSVAGASVSGGTNAHAGSNAGGGANAAGAPSAESGAAGDSNGAPPYWKPEPGLSWQWQLSESVSAPLDVDVYDIDWESDAAVVQNLHARGIFVICYVSVGSWEDYRPDADDFPTSVIGNDYEGWPGEKYVDLRSPELRRIMAKRFDICREKGFDAIEPDNMDVFELGSESGFPLTRADGVEFAHWLADEAHARGLGIGQKNAASITAAIEPSYDWALTESCYSDGNWCGDVSAYVSSGKPVFMCEYEASSFAAACAAWTKQRYSPILKNLDLDAQLDLCP